MIDRGDDEIGELARAFDRMRIQLAQLDTARKEFVANASHELRTPLFSIGGFLELLSDEDLDEETRQDFLDDDATQVERLTKLSTDLLDLSRVDAGQLQRRVRAGGPRGSRALARPGARARRRRVRARGRGGRRGRGVGARRRGARAPDRARPGDERAGAHAVGDADRRAGEATGRARRRSRSRTTGQASPASSRMRSSSASTAAREALPGEAAWASRSARSSRGS